MINMNRDFYYFDNDNGDYPMTIGWKHPGESEDRTRILRSRADSDEFFDWFLAKYPGIKYSVN